MEQFIYFTFNDAVDEETINLIAEMSNRLYDSTTIIPWTIPWKGF